MKRNIFYFPLESVKSRYTHQLSNSWMPDSLNQFDWNVITIQGKELKEKDIKVGHVFDSIGRSIYSFSQVENFLENYLDKGLVKNNDIIFFQDFWTPGIESIYYALNLHNIEVKSYARIWAQSVDEYDFTYSMKSWMRGIELGYDKFLDGIFVGSTVHRDELRAAGFITPVHVLSLPLGLDNVKNSIIRGNKKNKQVVFTSRINSEKNPFFMLETAKRFLDKFKDYKWICTTSSPEFRSDNVDIVKEMKAFSVQEPRFIMKNNLSKEEYYQILDESEIQFNSSLQDYVAWTMLEAVSFDCKLVYPNFKSFKECILDKNYLYEPFQIEDVLNTFSKVIHYNNEDVQKQVLNISDTGRLFESYIMFNDLQKEFNIWHEYDLIKYMIKGI